MFGKRTATPLLRATGRARAPSNVSLKYEPPVRNPVANPKNLLETFDSTISELFIDLSRRGDELAETLLPDVSCDEVLKALEKEVEILRRGPKLEAAVLNMRAILESMRTRLLTLIEGKESTLDELASCLVMIAETSSHSDQRSAALILDSLLKWEGIDLSQFEKGDSAITVKFSSLVRIILTKNSERLALAAAARALGRLARISDSASRVDFVKFETVRAMEWLHLDAYANRRLAAVLILRYLTEMVPMLFVAHDHAISFFDRISSALLDASPETRFAARDSLRAFFSLINTREDQEMCFRKCYGIVRRGIERVHTSESIHGALLAIAEMLRNPNDLLRPVFANLCQEILRFRSHHDEYVVRAVIAVVPDLAAFTKDFASTEHLRTALDLLITKAAPGTVDRTTNEAALNALGLLVSRINSADVFRGDTGRLVQVLRECLRCVELAQSALSCLCSLAQVMAEDLLRESLSLIDDAFSFPAGLVQVNELLSALDAYMQIPAARPLIRARLVHEISIALTGRPFTLPAHIPRRFISPEDSVEEEDTYFFVQVLSKTANNSSWAYAARAMALESSSKLQQSALKALAKFDFGPLYLAPFLRQRVFAYLDSKSPLRNDACLACIQALSRLHERGFSQNLKANSATADILSSIVFLATADLDPNIRIQAMQLLRTHSAFCTPYLAQARCLQLLFPALNDAKFQVRQNALYIICSVTRVNPGYVLPFMRKYVISLIGSLKSPSSRREEIETSALLEDVIRGFYQPTSKDLGETLLGPYIEGMVKELVHKLRGSDQATAHFIQMLGACSCASDQLKLIEKQLVDAMPIVIEAALDSEASQKQRQSAFATLTELLKRTEAIGHVQANRNLIDPLLAIASAPPNSEYAWGLQSEVLRCLGTLGALDPALHQLSSVEGGFIVDETTYRARTTIESEFGISVLAVGRPSRRKRIRRNSIEAYTIRNSLGRSQSPRMSTLLRFEDENGDNSFKYDKGSIERTERDALADTDDDISDSSSDQSDAEDNILPVRGPVAEYGSSTQEQLESHFRLVAVHALIRILYTPSLASFHTHVVEAAGNTCRSLGFDILPYLSKLVPAMLRVALTPRCDLELRRTTIKQLTVFVSVMKKHMRPYMKDILSLARMFWDDNLFECLALVEETSSALREEFVDHISWVIPKLIHALRRITDTGILMGGGGGPGKKNGGRLLDGSGAGTAASTPSHGHNNTKVKLEGGLEPSSLYLRTDSSRSPAKKGVIGGGTSAIMQSAVFATEDSITRRALGTVQFLGLWISESEHSHRIAAEIINILESRAASETTKVRSLEVLRALCQHDTFSMDMVPILQCVVRVLCTFDDDHPLVIRGLDLFGVLVERSQHDFVIEPFIDMLPERWAARLKRRRRENMLEYQREDGSEDGASDTGSVEESGNNILLTAMITEVSKSRADSIASIPSDSRNFEGGFGPLLVNPLKLKEALEASQATTEDDWIEWMRRFSVELLRQSPDPTLRSCASVGQAHQTLARDLFNAAFASCWMRLGEDDRFTIVRTIKLAFKHKNTPPDVVNILLNLCEFMDNNDRPLPIERMSEYAMKCHAYAKALHYKELEFKASKNAVIIDDLISINHRLERHEAAWGLLKMTQNQASNASESGVVFSSMPGASMNQNGVLSVAPPQVPGSALSMRRRGSVHTISVQIRETWYEQLGRWRDALESYEMKLSQMPDESSALQTELTIGSMRCMLSLGEYDKLCDLARSKWPVFDSSTKQRVAPLIAHALWEKGADAREMKPFLSFLDDSKLDGAVLNAVAAIQHGDWAQSRSLLDDARRALASEISTSVSESYARAYPQIVIVQQLVELEEVAQFRQSQAHNSESVIESPLTASLGQRQNDASLEDDSLARLKSLWDKRLRLCQKSVNVWQKLMAGRILVIPPKDDASTWIKFVSICRREERWGLARSTLRRLGVVGDYEIRGSLANGTPKSAIYAMLKLCWVGANDRPPAGDKSRAFTAMVEFVDTLTATLNATSRSDPEYEETRRLVVKSRLKLGEWTSVLHGDVLRQEAMRHVEVARKLEPTSYKAAHAWASLNFLQFESGGGSFHLVEAISGFFQSIALGRNMGGSTSIVMQDVLRLLTLWFDQSGKHPKAAQAIRDGFTARRIPIGTWLNVVPQLLARIQGNPTMLRELLVELGSTYPQALVYPLTVAARSVDPKVRGAAEGILSELRRTQAVLLDQAALVARELIRVAILLPEEWYEALEDACKAWYPVPANEGEVRTRERARERYRALKGVQECFADLNSRLGDYPGRTRHEADFLRKFGKNLQRAAELVNIYEERRGWELPGKNRHMQDAWAEYKKIYAEIGERYLKELSVLDLDEVSPMLLAQKNLELAVPGTFRADVDSEELVRIKTFGSRVKVFPTKQRPRRIGLLGSNGYVYRYLLKGHEDLRQDERAMQLFGLVNALLSRATLKRDLAIQTYIVIPLSPHVGLIGWLPQTDTLHSLIRKYRAEKRVPLNIEQQWGNKISPLHIGGNSALAAAALRDPAAPGNSEGYDRLTLLQKVEAFQFSLESNAGDDLAKVIWYKSRTAEIWLDRRTIFTRSLATMSMVGYILGLGDRHPSNLMIHRASGRIVHIDFGDCFEVAAHREKYPERVPFRLTRMLVNAMEVSGLEGNFRISCEAVMGVLRDNRDSVMAMLEAFVHDPLISWRLWAQQHELQEEAEGGKPSELDPTQARTNIAAPPTDIPLEEEEEGVESFLGRDTPLDRVEEENSQEDEAQQNIRMRVQFREEQNRAMGDDEEFAKPVAPSELAHSSRAQPIPLSASQAISKARAGSVSALHAAGSIAQSRRQERASMMSLSQSYRSRAVRDRQRVRRLSITFEQSEAIAVVEPVLNKQAVQVVRRVKDKLTGHDFGTAESMSVVEQVNKLVQQATAPENLATAFIGWCAFW